MPDEYPTIAELAEGTSFTGRYACVRKDRLTARNGSTYLALELRDRTGTIPARIFREVDPIAARFDRGDAVEVRGRVERFHGRLSAEVESLRKLGPGEVDPAGLLPTAYRDREELEGFLEHLAREVHDPGLREVTERLLFTGEAAGDFRQAPCTRAGHHSYIGGLLEHTVAVATLASETCVLHRRLDSDLLLAASLIHDVGKTREFVLSAEIGLTDEGKLLGHLQLGAEMIARGAEDLERDRRNALLATVMCHHGTEALRLRSFPSPEAVALYRLNALDAQVKGALEHGQT